MSNLTENSPIPTALIELARQLGQRLQQQGIKVAVAESCTGGGVAYAITEIPGSSAWFDRGFVCYSNAAKMELLAVHAESLAGFGAVSPEVALEMVNGALQHSLADVAIAVTGIAGPDGGSLEKPVGTVFIAVQKKGGNGQCFQHHFSGDRQAIRQHVIAACLQHALDCCQAA